MFGIIYLFGTVIGSTISGIKCFKENAEGIARGKERRKNHNNISNTYYDRKGIQRYLDTHQIATIKTDIDSLCDDEYLYLGTPGIKTRNLSEEKRKDIFEKGKRGNWCGRTVDIYDQRRWTVSGHNKYKTFIQGAYYVDLYNNKIYVCRSFPLIYDSKAKQYRLAKKGEPFINCKFYMDIKNGFLVRKSDTQIEFEKEHNTIKSLSEKETENFIEQFNTKQKDGNWYDGTYKYSNAPQKIRFLQNHYCDDFNCYDHIYNLVETREVKS